MTTVPRSLTAWVPSLRGTLLIIGAFLFGLLVFAFVWRGQERAPTPELAPIARSGPDFAPLPAPMAADGDGASGLEEPDEEALADQPRLIEPPRPTAPLPREDATPAARAPSQVASSPVPISQVPPRYPQRAMRRGEEGLVRVKVEVGADGEPSSVSVETSSQSRELDRAALDAVRRWRFQPAKRDGIAVAGTLIVPIEFKR